MVAFFFFYAFFDKRHVEVELEMLKALGCFDWNVTPWFCCKFDIMSLKCEKVKVGE